MKVAVVTPCHNTPPKWLDQCRKSVEAQTYPCTHVLVDDGSEPPMEGPIIRLPKGHADTGNAGRAVGAVASISEGFDAVAFLDSDNWYEPSHIESLVILHQSTKAAVCTSSRNLYTVNGVLMGKCPEVDGKKFVDTNCLMFTRKAFLAVALWYMIPPDRKLLGDRFVWDEIIKNNFPRAYTGLPTVAYRTNYRVHYAHFGLPVPIDAK